MNRLNKTESAVFLFCRFPLFLKDLFVLCVFFSDNITPLKVSQRFKQDENESTVSFLTITKRI